LEKKPARKSKCPHCGELIYVRSGDLLRADELEQATAATGSTRKPTKKKPAPSKERSTGSKPKPRKAKPKPQGQLAADIKRKKKKEKYGPDDLLAGLQLLLKVAGALLAGGGLTTLLSNLFGAQPATRNSGDLAALVQNVDHADLLQAISDAYTSLTEQEQFQMRAVVTWLQNGFQLPADAT
jgi:hypothetical protein